MVILGYRVSDSPIFREGLKLYRYLQQSEELLKVGNRTAEVRLLIVHHTLRLFQIFSKQPDKRH